MLTQQQLTHHPSPTHSQIRASGKMLTDFRYFRYRIFGIFGIFRFISFRFASKNSVSLQSETSEANLFFAILLRSFSLPFRFVSLPSEIWGHPNCNFIIIYQLTLLILHGNLFKKVYLFTKMLVKAEFFVGTGATAGVGAR